MQNANTALRQCIIETKDTGYTFCIDNVGELRIKVVLRVN